MNTIGAIWDAIANPHIGGAIGTVGFVVTLYALWDARRTGMTLKDVRDSISTSYVGEFPDNLEAIIKELNRARRSIRIAVDHCAYGAYSDYGRFSTIKKILETKHAEGVAVEIVTLAEALRHKMIDAQFDKSLDFKTKIESTELFKSFGRAWGGPIKSVRKITDQQSFLKSLHDVADHVTNMMQLGNQVFKTSEMIPLYLWIIDDDVALFSIANLDVAAKETTFRTTDFRLIAQLQIIYNKVRRSSDVQPVAQLAA